MFRSIKAIKTDKERFKMPELRLFIYSIATTLVLFGAIYLIIREHYEYMFEYVLVMLFEVFILVLMYRIFKFASLPVVLGVGPYSHSNSTLEELKLDAQKLDEVLKDLKPYLNKKLTLNQLSEVSEISPNKLSQLFAVYYKSSFYDYINSYRLKHAEELLVNPDVEKYTITAKSEMSGFNSKATFYKVFRDKHAMSPSEFLKKSKNAED